MPETKHSRRSFFIKMMTAAAGLFAGSSLLANCGPMVTKYGVPVFPDDGGPDAQPVVRYGGTPVDAGEPPADDAGAVAKYGGPSDASMA